MPIRALLFDKDGTLFDFAATWEAWARAFLRRIADGDDTRAAHLAAAVGFDWRLGRFSTGSVVIAGTPEEVAAALMPHLGLSRAATIDMMNEEAARAPQVEAVPLAPLLDGFRARGLALGVATNDAEAPARAHLAGAGVTDRFDFIAGSDSGFGAKPEPGQCLAFAQAVGIAPEEIVMIGDSLHDLIAGRAAGMRSVAVLTGLADAASLAPFAEVVLPDIGALPDWLGPA